MSPSPLHMILNCHQPQLNSINWVVSIMIVDKLYNPILGISLKFHSSHNFKARGLMKTNNQMCNGLPRIRIKLIQVNKAKCRGLDNLRQISISRSKCSNSH